MKKTTLTFFLAAMVCSFTFAQHIMEVIPPDNRGAEVTTLVHRNIVYMPNFRTLHVYDGHMMNDVPLPAVDGVQVRFDNTNGFFVFNDEVHLTVERDALHQYIARFSGGTFTLSLIPGIPESTPCVFNGKIYLTVQTESPDQHKLISYDGVNFRDVHVFPYRSGELTTSQEYLYIRATESAVGEYHLLRYNGFAMTRISLPENIGRIIKVFEIDGSDRCYLIADNAVLYYNGATATVLFQRDLFDVDMTGQIMWRNELYFRTSNLSEPTQLHRCSGAVRTTIAPPAGTQFLRPNLKDDLVVYRDALYIPVDIGGVPYVFRYNGSGWGSVFSPGIASTKLQIRERPGKLVFFQHNFSEIAYEYNGFGFDSFSITAGADFFTEYQLTTRCYHLWLAAIDRPDLGGFNFTLMKETFDSLCVAPGSRSVIPGHIAEYDRLIIGNHGRERDWCWTGIDVDWEWPICIPPCTTPQMRTSLTDKSGKTAWEKIFDKPFNASIPLNDSEPYSLSIDIEKDKKFGRVLLLDKELVNNGVEDLSLDFYPKDGYFFLDVETDKKQQVPLAMTLRNANGESLWEKKFTAPFHDVIYDRVDKAGDYLQFSLQAESKSNVTYYPNPFTSKLNIAIAKGSDPVSVSVMNMNGKTIMQKDFDDAGEYSIELNGQKSGLYILTIKEGVSIRRELIELKE